MKKSFNVSAWIYSTLVVIVCACHDKKPDTLFTRLPETETGITFRNLLKEDNPEFNILRYPYFYNGGGVAVGDINNDSLPDIFFTGNMVKNRLFINNGHFKFEDITSKSQIARDEGWCTGVTMTDINEDGWLDIYVCRAGFSDSRKRKNLLYINNHDLTFTEQAEVYGLADAGYSTQASFFDYDRDGDLDMFLINQSAPEYAQGQVDYIQMRHQAAHHLLENKLYRNDNKRFVNVTREAGIHSSVFTFSLGLSTADLNQDGWPDIYIGNDFKEPDHYYINNHNGTFTDSLAAAMDHGSLYSMGVDVADYNNDLLPDVMVLDMLSEDNYAQKMHMGGDNYTQYNHLFRNGMYCQYMKNSLQKNNGDGTFSEIAQLAGVSNTDWSWSPLFADFDNDGKKDLFISNGYKRDNTDMQFIVYSMNQSFRQQHSEPVSISEYIAHMPGIYLPNYIFRNEGNDRFESKTKDWGFDHNTISHGAACADLDNDGDLDIVTNNTDAYAGIYRNNSEVMRPGNFIKIELKGTEKNNKGIGAKIYAYAGADKFYVEQVVVRGYQSSINNSLHIGLGGHQQLDSLYIQWPDGMQQILRKVNVNRIVLLDHARAELQQPPLQPQRAFLTETNILDYRHIENYENDFLRQFLLPHFFSHNGPCMAKADVNGDRLEDIFIGGAKGNGGAIFIQQKNQQFVKARSIMPEGDVASEDTDAAFFDADGDGDQDLYVVSGGYEFEANDRALQDRLYLNNGRGQFAKSILPKNYTSKKCIAPCDIDADGDMDIFVGGGIVPGRYPEAVPSKVFINNGKGEFTDQSLQYLAELDPGYSISDAVWTDLDKDGRSDLVAVGEWTPLIALINTGSALKNKSKVYFPFANRGWWNVIASVDMDNDGDEDIIAGNYGLNAQVKANVNHPLEIYSHDIDGNGSVDPVITHYIGNTAWPMVPRDDMVGQVPSLKKKFNDYPSYARATIGDILKPELLAKGAMHKAEAVQTTYIENRNGYFTEQPLPVEAQYAPVYTIATPDVNGDGNKDLILGGNNIYNRIYLGRHDANHGVVLLGDGSGNFQYIPPVHSGIGIRGDVRSMIVINDQLIIGVNNEAIKAFRINASPVWQKFNRLASHRSVLPGSRSGDF